MPGSGAGHDESGVARLSALPFGLELWQGAVLLLAVFAAFFARGYSGFGASAILVTAGSLVTDPANVVALTMIFEIAATIVQVPGAVRHVHWPRAGWLLAGALVGTPLGVMLLTRLSPDHLKLLLAALILAASIALMWGASLKRRTGALGTGLVGVGSGVANGAAAVGGLPVALFLSAEDETPKVFRATMILYLGLLDIIGSTLLVNAGITTVETALAAAIGAPVMLLGLWMGGRHFLSATPDAFRRSTLWLLVALALTAAGQALWNLA